MAERGSSAKNGSNSPSWISAQPSFDPATPGTNADGNHADRLICRRDVDPAPIEEELNSKGYVIFHDPEIQDLSKTARAEYENCLRSSPLHATRQRFHYSALAERPWRKLAIGSSNGLEAGERAQICSRSAFRRGGQELSDAWRFISADDRDQEQANGSRFRIRFGSRASPILGRLPRSPLSTRGRLHGNAPGHPFPAGD